MASDGGKSGSWAPVQVKGFCGGIASGVAKLVVGHPFDTLKVRLQTEGYHGRFKTPLHCLAETVRKEGFRALYKGATPPLIGWSAIDAVMFSARNHARRYFAGLHPDGKITIFEDFLAGLAGGWACSIVSNPVEQVKSRLQVQYADKESQRYKGPVDCIKQLYRNNGILGFYNGMSGTLFYRCFTSIYFGAYEATRTYLEPTQIPSTVKNFVSGGLAATVFWCFSMPADTIKNRLFSQPDVPRDQRKYKNMRECIKIIYEKEGFKGFYRGFVPCLLRSFPTNGAAFLAYELVMTHL